MKEKMLRSWVEVDIKALAHNFRQIKKAAGGAMVMSVVKSNAYGHGMIECAKVFVKEGTDWLAVDDIDEALVLRKKGVKKPILVLGYTLPSRYADAAKNKISITISSIEQLKQVVKYKSRIKIHLKIDTGLHRQGIPAETNFEKLIYPLIQLDKRIELEGLYSHFAAAENPENKVHVAFTKKQIEKFVHAVEQCKAAGFNPMTHIAGTAATLLLKSAHFDMVRAGIGLYGLWPSEQTRKTIYSSVLKHLSIDLKPALGWKSVICEVKIVRKGEGIGYDLIEKLTRDSALAVIPVGYWHGYPRVLSNKGIVLVRGKKCKVIGRISMDMTIIDVTDIRGVREGDEVELIGKNITADELANLAGTINYEIVTRINTVVPQKFI